MIVLDFIIVPSDSDEAQMKNINRRLNAVNLDGTAIVAILPRAVEGVEGGLIVYFRYKTHWGNLHE